jgi:hypothetical protein
MYIFLVTMNGDLYKTRYSHSLEMNLSIDQQIASSTFLLSFSQKSYCPYHVPANMQSSLVPQAAKEISSWQLCSKSP